MLVDEHPVFFCCSGCIFSDRGKLWLRPLMWLRPQAQLRAQLWYRPGETVVTTGGNHSCADPSLTPPVPVRVGPGLYIAPLVRESGGQ